MKIVLICMLVFAGGSALLTDDDAKKVIRAIDGTWRLESVEEDGKALDEPGDNGPRWKIKGTNVQYAGESLLEIKTDEATTPKSLDLVAVNPKRTYEGIYSLEGDTLKICVNRDTEGVKDRPQDFVTEKKPNIRLLVFKRDTNNTNDPLAGVNGFVGIMIGLDEERKSVIIAGAFEGSPAKKAGLQKDDVLISINGNAPSDLQAVVKLVRAQKPEQEITFVVKRDGQSKEIRLKVGKMPFLYLD